MEINKVYLGDCASVLSSFPSGAIDLVVTSPPYDNLRTYGGGADWSFDKFKEIADQLSRVLKPGGVIVWIVSDATIDGSETGTSFRQALYFKETGLNLHDTMIWAKDGGGAIGSNKCYTQNFEYMFVFSKGTPKASNLIYDKPNGSAGEDKSGVGRRTKDGALKIEQRQVCAEFSKRNNWWLCVPSKTTGSWHPAVFPESLVLDHIRTWSNEGELVLDPFMGSGTTAIAARKLDRNFIGVEINPEYQRLATQRIFNEGENLFNQF